MIYIRVLSIALCAAQVISLPVSSLSSEDDTKVMKCVVEVISDTLSKPNPVPISQDCLETLRGDERIISILRHQNLLKELQDLAAQGAMDRLQKKKSGGFGGELSGVFDKQNSKLPEKSDMSAARGKSSESDEGKRQPEEEEDRRVSSEHPREENSEEELESNDISKREDSSEDEEIDNHITDEINDMEPPKDNQEDTSGGRTSEEKETISKKEPEASPIDDSSDSEKENLTQEGNETDNEEDDTQREDNSMRVPEEFNKETTETESSQESKRDGEMTDCKDEPPNSDEDTPPKDLEDSKRWNKMDELAKELRAKKCATSGKSEEDPDRSMKIPPKDKKHDLGSQERADAQQWQHMRVDSSERQFKRPEERKEEGSAARKTEDLELESLAAIEAELENVAHKLHDLRRG